MADKQFLVCVIKLYLLKVWHVFFPVVKIKDFKIIAAYVTANIIIYITRIVLSLGYFCNVIECFNRGLT